MRTLAVIAFLLLANLPLAAQANCTFILTPSSVSVAASTNPLFQGSFRVDANLNSCVRNAVSNANWLTVQLGQTGTGDGIVGYAVENNLTPVARSGTISVGSAAFTVNQAANPCRTTVTLQGGNGITADGGTRVLNVETTCQWTAVSTADWITFSSPNGTTGNGAVVLNIGRNTTARTRTATVTVGTQSVVINQAAANCSYVFAPAALQASPGGGTLFSQIQTTCEWNANSSATWLRASPASGTGFAQLTITVAENGTATDPRTATITAGSATLTVTQPPAPCNLQFTSTPAQVAAAGGSGSIGVNTSCATWIASATVPWIRLMQSANAVAYTVEGNPSAQPRQGEVRAGPANVTISQAGSTCTYTLTPETLDIPAAGSQGSVTVSAGAGCAWTPLSSTGWFRIGAVVEGRSFAYTADANPSGDPRTATVAIATRTLNVTQAAQSNAPRLAAGGVVSAASYAGGGVAPGEIVTIFGANLGPAELTTLQLTGDGLAVSSSLAGTRALFDGIAAPMVYTAAGQVSAVVPYGIAGRGSVNLQVEYRGVRSNALSLPVLEAKPALFSRDSSGSGPGAILNEDNGVNGPDRPARAGSIIVLYGTGEGLPDPVPGDGAVITGAPLPRPRQTVNVLVDGIPAQVLYAGAAPSLVAGVLQINVRLPAGVTGAAVPLRISVGEIASTSAISVNVR